jgi:hypothetical protein
LRPTVFHTDDGNNDLPVLSGLSNNPFGGLVLGPVEVMPLSVEIGSALIAISKNI